MSPQRFALIGWPIDQSPSPAMHNAGFAALGLDARYELRSTTESELDQVFAELEQGVWQGLNVTTPLKSAVAARVETDELARRAGAVNTVWRDGTRLVGSLTDVLGVQRPLEHAGFSGGGEALLLGAGGAARAAAVALGSMGTRVHVASRRQARASELLRHLSPAHAGLALPIGELDEERELVRRLDVIIQATPVRRASERHRLPWTSVKLGAFVLDMVYHPKRTAFLDDAQQAGARVLEGWEMLLEQGLAAFECFTGREAPREAMRRALLEKIH